MYGPWFIPAALPFEEGMCSDILGTAGGRWELQDEPRRDTAELGDVIAGKVPDLGRLGSTMISWESREGFLELSKVPKIFSSKTYSAFSLFFIRPIRGTSANQVRSRLSHRKIPRIINLPASTSLPHSDPGRRTRHLRALMASTRTSQTQAAQQNSPKSSILSCQTR